MTMIYSNPAQEGENDGALPDVEVRSAPVRLVGCRRCGGETELPSNVEPMCYSCGDSGRVDNVVEGAAATPCVAWWWWPIEYTPSPGVGLGYRPDGEPNGPFATEAEAIADAQCGEEHIERETDDYSPCSVEPDHCSVDDMTGEHVSITGERTAEHPFPPCVLAMGCYCAKHARGNPVSEPCNTNEHADGAK